MRSTLRQNKITSNKKSTDNDKEKPMSFSQMRKNLELIIEFLGEDFQKFKEQKSNTQ